VNVRLSAFGGLPVGARDADPAPHRRQAAPDSQADPAPDTARAGEVTARLPGSDSARPLPVYQRDRIEPGQCVAGPAIVHQLDSTTVVLPGQRARVDTHRSMWLEGCR
jgi:N-methylhydantoinase A